MLDNFLTPLNIFDQKVMIHWCVLVTAQTCKQVSFTHLSCRHGDSLISTAASFRLSLTSAVPNTDDWTPYVPMGIRKIPEEGGTVQRGLRAEDLSPRQHLSEWDQLSQS